MTCTIARLIGGAGTGKTTELMNLMQGVIEAGGIQPGEIGFVSFTRAARAEAVSRAAERFGIKPEILERSGWFRTLHSICYRCLEAGNDLLTDNAKSRKWIEGVLQAPMDSVVDADDEMGIVFSAAKTEAARALAIWGAARNRLEPYDLVWQKAADVCGEVPPLEWCRSLVDRYELHKRLDHRRDFTDLLGQFSGWRFHLDGHDQGTPLGFLPELPVWFFDEQQDTSPLLDSVCRRLIAPEACRWVYVVGDPFQAIYGFAGADARCFLAWPAQKERIMPKSYRCPKPVHDLGERILQDCSDYFDRGIQAADHPGQVDEELRIDGALVDIDPRESWLLIARTNFQAKRFQNKLNQAGIPWQPTRGNGGWSAPKRNLGLSTLVTLQKGAPLMPAEWRAALDLIPSRHQGADLLVRGTKTQWEEARFQPEQEFVSLGELGAWGATPRLIELLGSGGWQGVVEHGEEFSRAVDEWGFEAVQESGIRVGTIHSVKGQEADNVVLLTTISEPVARSGETQEGKDEELRVAYVGVTRARRRLIVVNEPRERNKMEVPL